MSSGDRSGRGLEHEVAQLFRDAGCEAQTRIDVEGARGWDNVDVWVEFESLGMTEKWLVECKDEKRPAEKDDVRALRTRVENVGASRGVLVSRNGFQRGCDDVAAKTNILLTDPIELADRLDTEISTQRLHRVLARVTVLVDRLTEMKKYGTRPRGGRFRMGMTVHLPSGPGSDQYFSRLGKLTFIKTQVTDVLIGRHVYLVPSDEEDPHAEETLYDVVGGRAEFCDIVEQVVAASETWADGLVPPE